MFLLTFGQCVNLSNSKKKKKTCTYTKKIFKSIDFISKENDRKFTFYPEFLDNVYNKNFTCIESTSFNLHSSYLTMVLYIAKISIIIYIIGLLLFHYQIFVSNFALITKFIYSPFIFLFFVLFLEQFLFKSNKSSKFIRILFIKFFLLSLSIITEQYLKLTEKTKKNFIIFALVKICLLIDLWFDKYFSFEFKNTFFKNSKTFRKIKSVFTVIIILDLISLITVFFSSYNKLQYSIVLSQFVKNVDFFMPSDKQSIFVEILDSSYGILFLFGTNCISFFFYHIAFKRRTNNENINFGTKKYSRSLENSNTIVAFKKKVCDSISTFDSLKTNPRPMLYIDELITEEKNKENITKIDKWIIKKNGINIPFSIALYANEYQSTKRKTWYEFKK
nr:HAN_1g46 [Cryptomonas sp.]